MAVVVIPVYNAPDETIACLNSILRHTPADVAILIIDDHGSERHFFDQLDQIRSSFAHVIEVRRPDRNLGFVGACNLAFEITQPNDVILVNSDVVVGPEWYVRIIEAANTSNDVATVSVFTNNGTILSLPHRNSPCPEIVGGYTVDEAAARIAQISKRTRPTIATAIGHCFLVKRSAINLVGGFDPIFGTGYGEEVDFSQRCIRIGLRHIVADDVFVFHKGSSSFTTNARPQQIANEAIVNSRYPWYQGAVQRTISDPHSSLATAINRASLQLRQPSIAFDGHCFASNWAGTQQMTAELIQSIARQRPQQEFTVVFSEHASAELVSRITSLPNLRAEIVPNIMEDFSFRFDVIIRPHQINSTEELRWMKRIANRTIVAQLDFISFNNPTYFDSDHSWLSQRELTRLVHATVDGIAWISEYVKEDADLIGVRRHAGIDKVIYVGTNPAASTTDPQQPGALQMIKSPIITVLGASYLHKNRIFALELLTELTARGIDCHLVFAGPNPPFGSSADTEQLYLDSHLEIRPRFTALPPLTEAEKTWLCTHSALVIYPTVCEGFGLVPFEVARLGTPTLSTRMGSLHEVLPHEIPTVDSFSVSDTADIIVRLLEDPAFAAQLTRSLLTRADDFTWDRTGHLCLELIDQVLLGPRNNIDAIWAEAPITSAIHAPDYIERISRRARKANTMNRLNQFNLGRSIIGSASSRRRYLLKKIYAIFRR